MLLTHKKVNVISKKGLPLYFLKINTSLVYNIVLPLSDILMAIQMDCIVEEETNNGKIILDINNFDRDLNVHSQDDDDKYYEDSIEDSDNNDITNTLELEVEHSVNKIKENKNSLISRLIKEQNNIKNKKI